MKILHITARDTVGERFNGTLIHRELLARGHDSHMFVRFKRGDDPRVFESGTRLTRTLDNHTLVPLERGLSLQGLMITSDSTLFFTRAYRESDLVHFQLIHASPFFSLLNAPIMGRRKKLIWTIHDPWMMTGHCVHPLECDRWRFGCGECPDLGRWIPMKKDRTALMWRIKKAIFKRSRPTLVVASRYMEALVSDSPILRDLPRRVIPFGVSSTTFRPEGRAQARARLQIPTEAHVLAFRNRGLEDPHKGGHLLLEALKTYQPSRRTILLVLEKDVGLEALSAAYTIKHLGWIESPSLLADALRASDLFLMPSVAEAFGLMAVEAMGCGTPVVVCEGTSLPEVVMAPRGGLAVPQNDPIAFAAAINSLLAAPEKRHEMGEEAARLARAHYSEEAYVGRHIELYRELLEVED